LTITGGGATSNRPSTGRLASEGAPLSGAAAQAASGSIKAAAAADRERTRFIANPDMGAPAAQQEPNRYCGTTATGPRPESAKSTGFGG
jgi:hypothetical protein